MSNKTKRQSGRADEARRAYYKAWRGRNRERIKLYNKRYWEKKARENAKEVEPIDK